MEENSPSLDAFDVILAEETRRLEYLAALEFLWNKFLQVNTTELQHIRDQYAHYGLVNMDVIYNGLKAAATPKSFEVLLNVMRITSFFNIETNNYLVYNLFGLFATRVEFGAKEYKSIKKEYYQQHSYPIRSNGSL